MSKKEHILNVAEGLFNQLGYTAVGVDLIRDKAEVSKTSMYRHFGSKNKLIEAVLIRRHQRFEEELNAVVSAATDTDSRLNAILDWHFSWFRAVNFKGCMFMHALAEFRGHDEALAQQALKHKAWLKSLLFSTFEPGEPGAEAKTEAIMTFLEGMIIRAEFGEVSGYEEIYRLGARALAVADFTGSKAKAVPVMEAKAGASS
ncbi:TetR/AcrR family transcriptional regulator [Photobacterium atrarenae]|uniref:TetR/AcrR family transcriptional regulator n=1 Tax=Photobacterium atrarenae TaxID=865757 RepID=A0ABY5GNH8_9GAMM|nr:TetR/AcrR family transcriptional regulator [Photobacterium atrarenae]UTV30797.1 TetR/AcrR family transcriptional regulator [Photobacterium atrarenae]